MHGAHSLAAVCNKRDALACMAAVADWQGVDLVGDG